MKRPGALSTSRTAVSAAGPAPTIPNRSILRREIEDQIERLILALDMMDPDPDADMEPDPEGEEGAERRHDDCEARPVFGVMVAI